jgi:hypothetical protein
MKSHLAKLSPVVLAVPLVLIGYPIVSIVVPIVIRSVVPQVVRTVLSLM